MDKVSASAAGRKWAHCYLEVPFPHTSHCWQDKKEEAVLNWRHFITVQPMHFVSNDKCRRHLAVMHRLRGSTSKFWRCSVEGQSHLAAHHSDQWLCLHSQLHQAMLKIVLSSDSLSSSSSSKIHKLTQHFKVAGHIYHSEYSLVSECYVLVTIKKEEIW